MTILMPRYSAPIATAAMLVTMGLILSGCMTRLETPPDQVGSGTTFEPGSLTGTDPNFSKKMAACLGDSGWEVTVTPDNSYAYELTDAQANAFHAAEVNCADELGYNDTPPAVSPEQMRRVYSALVALRDCLDTEGYPTAEPPSEQAFLGGALFDPYGELKDPAGSSAIDAATLSTLLEMCPRP